MWVETEFKLKGYALNNLDEFFETQFLRFEVSLQFNSTRWEELWPCCLLDPTEVVKLGKNNEFNEKFKTVITYNVDVHPGNIWSSTANSPCNCNFFIEGNFTKKISVKEINLPNPMTYQLAPMPQTNGLPPSPVQASLPASPPAQTKLLKSSWKFCPSLVARSWFWQFAWSTIGTSTSFWIAWYAPLAVKSFRPHPPTQQRIPVIKLLGRQTVEIVGNYLKINWTHY